mmetsp:Transcript_12904/g.47184  ORF Transcript_12904/g.47184 Transcript_12904/m.47184 type:complete len:288 (+) Transcript_12904:794-1657(+)
MTYSVSLPGGKQICSLSCELSSLANWASATPAARGADADALMRLDQDGVFASQRDFRPINVNEHISARQSLATSIDPVRPVRPTLAQNTNGHSLQEFHLTNNSVSALVSPSPTATLPQGELPQQDRVAALENLWISDASVGHVALHAAGAIPCWPCTAAPSDGFVVAEVLVAESKVVHATLGVCCCMEGRQDDISNTLGCQHVAPNDSRSIGWRQHAVLWNVCCDRCKAPLIQRNLSPNQGTQAVDYGRKCNGLRAVPVSIHLGSCALEVEVSTPFSSIDSQDKLYW